MKTQKRKKFKFPPPPKLSSARALRMALVRHAMQGEETRTKAPVTLPKLKFMET
jgi:hypothetical protein